VYLGRMVGKAGFERTVAVKVLHRHLATDPEFVAMFLDEARLSARIRHPNVVDVYDVDALDGELFIVMEYVEGAALNWILRLARDRQREVPVGFVLSTMHEVLLGLHAAHDLADAHGQTLGLVHRDVSPQNILVGADGIARVSDFGIAKAAGRIASTRGRDTVKGKLRYLSPEQLKRSPPVDRRTDVFAAGIVLWECLTGEPLFAGDTEGATMALLLNGTIYPPSSIAKGVPPEVDQVCLMALERDRDRRFPTAMAFADALEEAAGGRFFRARDVGAFVSEIARESIDRGRAAMRSAHTVRASDSNTHQTNFSARPQVDFEGLGISKGQQTSELRRERRWSTYAGIAAVAMSSGGLMAWLMARPEASPPTAAAQTPAELPTALTSAAAPSPGAIPSTAAGAASAPAPSASAAASASPTPDTTPSASLSGSATRKPPPRKKPFMPSDL
jgi:serine/threonine protein kinase